MHWMWTVESHKNRIELMKQGNDLRNIPVRFVGVELHDDELAMIIEPAIYPKDDYQLRANKDCKECNGKAYIRYYLAQDDCKAAPCHVCFPETATKSQWLRDAMK